MNEWNNFFVATAGGAAALLGLIFVGVSISLTKILSTPTLPGRALISLLLLLTILILSVLFLVPHQSLYALGMEVLAITLIIWIVVSKIDFGNYKNKQKKYQRFYIFNMILDQVAVVPYLIGGIGLLSAGQCALYWIVPAFIFSFIKAVIDAWVLLVEIHR